MLPPILFVITNTSAQVGLEQYFYVNEKEMIDVVPICSYRTRTKGYVEARYNYEDVNSFSLYVGKVIEGGDKITYAIVPMLGVVVGKFKGGSAGANVDIELGKLFFNTQSQYTFSVIDRSSNYIFSWSEMGYQPLTWFYFGVTTQVTYQSNYLLTEPGIVLGFTKGKWTFPLYSYNSLSDNRYFVLGITFKASAFQKKNKTER